MEIRDNKNVCIITPLGSEIGLHKQKSIFDFIQKDSRRIALDFKNLQTCSIEFIEALRNINYRDLSIFNIPSDIFVLFNIMNLDKFVKLYVSELDFEQNSRQIVNRKFTVV